MSVGSMTDPETAFAQIQAAARGRANLMCVRCANRGTPACPHRPHGAAGKCPSYVFNGDNTMPSLAEFPPTGHFNGEYLRA
jgi:hypothetical protein